MAIKNFDDMMDKIIEEVLAEVSKEIGEDITEAAKKVCDSADAGNHTKEFVAMVFLGMAQSVANGSIANFKMEWDGEKLEIDKATQFNPPTAHDKIDVNPNS